MGMRLIEDLPDDVVGVRADGEVDDDDYEDVLEPAIADRLTRHDKVRLLYVLGPEFTGYEADAMWEDTKLGFKTFTKYDKMAIVTDASWVRHSVKAFGWLIPGEVKVYPYEQLGDARTWITTQLLMMAGDSVADESTAHEPVSRGTRQETFPGVLGDCCD